jgi:hypothetical protein
MSAELAAESEEEAPAAAEPGPDVSATPALDALKARPLTTVDGRNLRVSFAVDPVLDLRASALAGHRVEARILDVERGRELTGRQRRTLLPSDFAKIDLAALERGMSRLTEADADGPPKLIIQQSFASLSNSRARSALIAKTAKVQHLLKQAVICELVDIENGVPVNRLLELNALIKPFFRSVWLQVQPQRALIETAKSARIPGLSVRAGDLGVDPQGVASGMRAFMSLVQRAAPVLTVTNLPLRDLSIEAMAAGFTHATLRAQPAQPAEAPLSQAG